MRRTCQLCTPLLFSIILAACGGDGDDNPRCGDGKKNLDEACDASDLAGSTCESLGFGPGTLACSQACEDFDRAGCGAPKSCGDNKLTDPEICDGSQLGGKTCAALGYSGGTLGCLSNCGGYDTTKCKKPVTCDNKKLDPKEVCDGDQLGGKTCAAMGFSGGTLACAADCLKFDTSGCSSSCVPDCKGHVCGLDPVCGTKQCGSCNGQSICDASSGACVQVCDLNAITADTTINLPLKTIKVSGVITLNGKDVPSNTKHSSSSRGSLRFYNKTTGAYVSADLGHSASATYSVTLYPGTYDVKLYPASSGYQDAVPAYTHVLEQGASLKTTTNKTYDLKTVKISGAVWLDGKQMPTNTKHSSSSRGSLRFYDKESSAYLSADLKHTGGAIYVVTLYAGDYDVKVYPASSGYQDVLPPYTHLAAEGLALKADNNKQGFFLKTVKVSGLVALDGATMPSNTKHSSSQRASLRFFDRKTHSYASADLGHSGPASFILTLFAGAYDVKLYPASSGYQDVLPPYTHVVQENLALSASATKNYDLKTVKVSGLVTLNGATMPTNTKHSSSQRASLRFTDSKAGSYVSVDLGHGGPASYATTLYAGTYGVRLYPASSGYQDVLPPYTHRLAQDVALSASATKNYNVKTVKVSGLVRLNSKTMPNNTKHSSSQRASLRFTDRKTWSYVSADLGHSGPASYTADLYAGSYDVKLYPASSGYQDVLPAYIHQLAEALALGATTSKDFDVKTVNVAGVVTLNSKTMPDNTKHSSASRGSVRFTDRLTGAYVSVDLGHSGAASYVQKLYPGTYDVDILPASSGYQDVLPPYRTKVRVGCFKAGPCSLSKSDVSGSWRLITLSSWGTVYLDLKQSGQSLNGTYKYTQSSGTITSGSVKGDSVEVTFKTYNCYVAISGSLQDGCTWTGSYKPSGTCGGGYGVTTSFFGQRSK
jgi:hypothetical protein